MTESSAAATAHPAEHLGAVGERCRQCSFALAADQRYCLNCGTRRAPARVDYKSVLFEDLNGAPTGAAAPSSNPGAASVVAAETRSVTPLGAAVALGLVLLAVLLGAVIGKGASDPAKPIMVGAGNQAAAQTTEAATTEATTTEAKQPPKSEEASGAKSDTSAQQQQNQQKVDSLAGESGDSYSEDSTKIKGLLSTGN